MKKATKIGVISDTHGYIRPDVFDVFSGVDRIFHAGDIGSEDIITALEAVAPVEAICGNVDTFPLLERYPQVLVQNIHGRVIAMVHDFVGLDDARLRDALRRSGYSSADIVICGHSHKADCRDLDGTLIFNPGSAGRKRFDLRPAVGLVTVQSAGAFDPEIIYLD